MVKRYVPETKDSDTAVYALLRSTLRLIESELKKAPFDPYKACREIHALTQRAIEAMDDQKKGTVK